MIRVAVVDDQALVRAGFVVLLESAPDLEVVGSAADGAQAVDLVVEQLTVINSNITELNALTSNDTIIINLSLSVRNIDQLVSVVNTIKRVKDVFSVERIIQ